MSVNDSSDSFNEKRALGISTGLPPSPRTTLARLTQLTLQSLRTRLMTSRWPGSSQSDSARRSVRTHDHSPARISLSLAVTPSTPVAWQVCFQLPAKKRPNWPGVSLHGINHSTSRPSSFGGERRESPLPPTIQQVPNCSVLEPPSEQRLGSLPWCHQSWRHHRLCTP